MLSEYNSPETASDVEGYIQYKKQLVTYGFFGITHNTHTHTTHTTIHPCI